MVVAIIVGVLVIFIIMICGRSLLMDSTYGIISLLPVLVTIVTAIITKRAVEPLICGALVGYIILDKQRFVDGVFLIHCTENSVNQRIS